MELRELAGDSFVSLTNWTWDEDFYGVRTTITAQGYGFAGRYDEVWFFYKELAAFVEALHHFCPRHEGEARLESMSPKEAVVSVRRWDAAGHVLVEAQVSRWLIRRGRGFSNSVSVAFELDPSQLPAAMEALAAVLAEVEPPSFGPKRF